MQINIWIWCREDVRQILAADSFFATTFDLSANGFWIDSETNSLDRILKLTENSSGIRLMPHCRFDKKEEEHARYFQAICRKTIRESEAAFNANFNHIKSLAPLPTTMGLSVKLMESVRLSKVAIHPLAVASLEWAAEYIAGNQTTELLKTSNMTGLQLRPIYHPTKKVAHSNVCHLYSKSIMPTVIRDASTLIVTSRAPEESPVRALGALCYDFSAETLCRDFNRTAEPFDSNQTPFWIVSRRVVELFEKHKVKGWAFRPVLEKGTPLYQEHLEKWVKLREKVASNPRHIFAS